MEKIKHLAEAALLHLLFTAFKTLPLDVASFAGGFMARAIGPYLSANRTAQKNLSKVFPNLTSLEKYKLLAKMWDNLGRNAAELPHLPGKKLFGRIAIKGTEHLPTGNSRPAIFFSGHFGNWELLSAVAFRHGVKIVSIYRLANNPYVDKMITDIRATQSTGMLPKGPKGAIKLGRAIKNGESLAMLIDQKMNDGLAVPFFGRDAMTAPAIAELALRYDMPIIPARVVRVGGCHFEATIYPPLQYEKTGDNEKDQFAIMTRINQVLESWIRERPEQWFWVHKRWPD